MFKNNIKYINNKNLFVYMKQAKKILIKDLININKVKEEINLFLYNSSLFEVNHLFFNNKFMEVLGNVEIKVCINN